MITRLKAALHETRCWECRVTWTSWAQRLIGMRRGYTPRLSKSHRALVERAQRAEAAVQRARDAIAERRTEVAEYEAEHGSSAWSDAVMVTCGRIEDALRTPPPLHFVRDDQNTASGEAREAPGA